MSTNRAYSSFSRRSYKKLWISFAVVFVVLVMLPIFLLAWMGFVPGISNLIGSAQQRDLGVEYTEADLDAYNEKASVVFNDYSLAPVNPDNPSETLPLAQPKTVNELSLTQEEVTAALNSTGWDWVPVENIQARITDGTLELSGMLSQQRLDAFKQYLQENDVANSDVTNIIDWIALLPGDAPLYARADAEIRNNVLSFKLVEAEIGNLAIPLGSVSDDLESGTSIKINADNFTAKSATLESGKLVFTGTYPTEIYLQQ